MEKNQCVESHKMWLEERYQIEINPGVTNIESATDKFFPPARSGKVCPMAESFEFVFSHTRRCMNPGGCDFF